MSNVVLRIRRKVARRFERPVEKFCHCQNPPNQSEYCHPLDVLEKLIQVPPSARYGAPANGNGDPAQTGCWGRCTITAEPKSLGAVLFECLPSNVGRRPTLSRVDRHLPTRSGVCPVSVILDENVPRTYDTWFLPKLRYWNLAYARLIAIHLLRPALYLNSKGRIQKFQSLDRDLLQPRARGAICCRRGW
jgi:hypothetical protein